ncbi:VOC family protein [Spirosoma sp. BT702]|uniref:VOC family protein n=1 Tax=Spirosoma profusum TaxID=2771354 RepID=A0A927GAG7_9BACT|nr:VOC family protein [Spirosoma profusum]MBD2705413.1 VOC family protein [Spirosoma profusum]
MFISRSNGLWQIKLGLNGQGKDLFVGIPVSNYAKSLDWYQRLFGCEPSFLPNDVEAVWQLAEHLFTYIIGHNQTNSRAAGAGKFPTYA